MKAKKHLKKKGRNRIINFNSFLFPSRIRMYKGIEGYLCCFMIAKEISKRHKLIKSNWGSERESLSEVNKSEKKGIF